jgi:hypothetical protein
MLGIKREKKGTEEIRKKKVERNNTSGRAQADMERFHYFRLPRLLHVSYTNFEMSSGGRGDSRNHTAGTRKSWLAGVVLSTLLLTE